MSQLVLARSYELGYSSITNGTIQSTNGNYILAGRLFDENSKSSAFALRAAGDGNLIWSREYTSQYSDFFQAITQIADGNFIATGSYFYSEFAGDEYLWIVKLNEAGEKIWEKQLGNVNEQTDGYDVTSTADGGFAVTGLIREKDTSNLFTWVLKFDSDGNLQWEKKYSSGVAYSISQTKDLGYILSGYHLLPGGLNSNLYVVRLDPAGNIIWSKIYDEYEIYVLLDSDIKETENGHFIVAAKSVVMEIGACGNIIWSFQNGAFNMSSVLQTPEGNYGLGGSLIVNNVDHAYIAVIDRCGKQILWDNTEILYPSGLTQIFVNQAGYATGGGYVPLNSNQYQSILAIFNPTESVN